MKGDSKNTHFKELQYELAERIIHLSAFIDTCFGFGNGQYGKRLIEPIDEKEVYLYGADFDRGCPIDLTKYRIGRNLPFFYEYVYHARCVQGIDWDDWDIDSSDALFREFLQLTDLYAITSSTGNAFPEWGIANSIMNGEEWRKSGLWEMMDLCDARHRLDFDEEVGISDIALLSGMNEKSVSNALRAEGENRLHSKDDETIESKEALRWLRSRKSGFKKTTFVSFDQEDLPESLGYMEIAPFINSRLVKFYGSTCENFYLDSAAKLLNYSREQITDITENVEKLPIKDIKKIAEIMKVDPAWFTEQVFSALFPEQMEMILYKKVIEYEVIQENQEKPFIEVTLTEKGIKNGYIDIPQKLSEFFPADSFYDRSKDKPGKAIELRLGTEVRNTDMRVKSSITISPKARFGSYLNKVVKAKAGNKIHFIKIDERVFELKFISDT